MGWIGIMDQYAGWFSLAGPAGAASGKTDAIPENALLPRGTLLIETGVSADSRPQTLLAFERTQPWNGRFSIQALPQGGIVLVDAQADDIRHATLPFAVDGRLDVLRLTYCWDAPSGWARLTLERPENDTIHSVELGPPLPMPLADLRAAMVHGCNRDLDEEVLFAAVSSDVEPVGPMPGLTRNVPVLTSYGEKTIGEIRRGDIVVTQGGAQVPVLQVVSRTVPARGTFQPIRLRAPYFGLRRDILVAPQQRLVMCGSQVEYMFGREAVLIPARHLVNDRSAFLVKGPELVTYHHVLLPGHEVITASGCQVESLYVGRLRRKPDNLANSVLAGFDRARLPEHAKPVWPVLKPFEAITLAMTHAA